MVESVTFSVPVEPSTFSCAPCHVRSPASVTTNVGIASFVDTKPWNAPITTATSSAAPIAGTAPQPDFTDRLAMIAAHRPETAPTDRSISPSSSTSTTPTETIPTATVCSARLVRLTGVRKRSWAIAKITQMIASVISTRSEPASPCPRRRSTARGENSTPAACSVVAGALIGPYRSSCRRGEPPGELPPKHASAQRESCDCHRPRDRADHVRVPRRIRRELARIPPQAQHDDPVRDREHIGKVVGDDQHAEPALAQALHELQHLRRL